MADLLFLIAGIIALAGLVLSFIRLLLGPSLGDRAIALDGMTIISLSGIALLAYFLQRIIYLDVALIYGILSFMAVIALARYLEKEL